MIYRNNARIFFTLFIILSATFICKIIIFIVRNVILYQIILYGCDAKLKFCIRVILQNEKKKKKREREKKERKK